MNTTTTTTTASARPIELGRSRGTIPHDNTVYIGYAFLAFSFLMFNVTEWHEDTRKNLFAIFCAHYGIALAYVVVLIFNKAYGIRKSWRKENIDKTTVLLNLFLISAYALNRELPVFEDSASWLCVYIILTSLVALSYRYYSVLPSWLNKVQHVMLGSAMVFYVYLSFFVGGYYPIGTIGAIFFGIGAHVFVPITLLAGSLFLVARHAQRRRQAFAWVAAGAIATMAYAAGFVVEWHSRVSKIETLANQSVMHPEVELPVWVKVGQYLQNDWITERILKSNLVYTMHNRSRSWSFLPGTASLDEVRRHDPFVYLASLRSRYNLPDDERIKILRAISDVRHRAQERLWSGDNLTTAYVVTDVDIYPCLRLAYTEKYFNVRNTDANQRWWGNSQEAIYTFHLPEGSVVTSLSLWIGGKEEKAILTSKQKATKAYKEIVGVEVRDPSVVHWQEGNTVTVRVFPCTPDEERKFKIGITSPLAVHDGEVVYKNITFNGPNAAAARATTRIRFVGATTGIAMPALFRKDAKGDYLTEGPYDENLAVAFKAAPLGAYRFSFDGYAYSMTDYVPGYVPFDAKRIFLDINNTWTEHEIAALAPLAKQYKLIVYAGDEFIQLNEENQTLMEELRRRNFSLFPFHLLGSTANALVVTKGNTLSPHLSDFKDSRFGEGIAAYFAAGHKVKVYNLAGSVATYISTFRELRGLTFAEGNVQQLKKLLADNVFPEANESPNKVVLHDAKMVITRTATTNDVLPNNAPDHLARLFAYNDIMRRVGSHYFNDDFVNDALVDQAATAYVVSPVSSLIVLESKRDYERFGIADKENSLHNAAKQSSGAVPEPHEWALIILFIVFVAYTTLRRVKQRLPV